MKKGYITPEMECIELQNTVSLLAGSNLDVMSGVNLGDAIDVTGQEADAPMLDDLDIVFSD